MYDYPGLAIEKTNPRTNQAYWLPLRFAALVYIFKIIDVAICCVYVYSPASHFKADQLWQGKRQVDATTRPLSKAEREQVSQLAVSVWDDDEDGDLGAANDYRSGLSTKRQVDHIYNGNFLIYFYAYLKI